MRSNPRQGGESWISWPAATDTRYLPWGLSGHTLRMILREIFRDPPWRRQFRSLARLRRGRTSAIAICSGNVTRQISSSLTKTRRRKTRSPSLERDEEDATETDREVETFEEAVQVVDEEDSPI